MLVRPAHNKIENLSRTIDTVKIPHRLTFKGARYGITPGCWLVMEKTAKEIAKNFGLSKLPSVGFESAIEGSDYTNRIQNNAGQYMIVLNTIKYRVLETKQV